MFCQSCGAQVSGAFCTRCGARAGQPSAPPDQPAAPPPAQPAPPPPSYAPPPQPAAAPPSYAPPPPSSYAPPPPYAPPQQLSPARSGGSGLKILLVVLGVLAVLGMLFVGALMYGWHKVKETAKSKGIDLNELSETHHGPGRPVDACSLLSKEELSRIVNMPVERTEGGGRSTDSTCRYFSSQAIDRATDAATEAIKRMQQQGAPADEQAATEKALREIGAIARGVGGAGGNGLVTSIEIQTENGHSTMAAFKIAMAAMNFGSEKHIMLKEDIKGLGDEAMVGPLASMFMCRKGDISISIDGRGLTGGRDAEIAIAKTILGRL